MKKANWNKFISENPGIRVYTAQVSRSLPKLVQFDKAGKRLPTPYCLFGEWAAANLSGAWSSTVINGVGFCIGAKKGADQSTIEATFGVVGTSRQTQLSPDTKQLGYTDNSYAELAKKLGYAVR